MTSEMMPGCPHCGCQLLTHACPGPDGFANTHPAPTLSEIVAAAEAWVEAERTIFHAGSERQADEAAHGITAARARFLSLVAAHAAEVAKVLEQKEKANGI